MAMAADSALTAEAGDDRKILTSMSKIFQLSRVQPVGIMIYGSAGLMEVPWEIIIKGYRKELADRSFDTLAEYADDFFSYLRRAEHNNTEEQQRRFVRSVLEGYFDFLNWRVRNYLEGAMELEDASATDIAEKVSVPLEKIVEMEFSLIEERSDEIPDITKKYRKEVKARFKDLVNEVIDESFASVEVSAGTRKRILLSAFEVFLGQRPIRLFTGIVIAGYGDKEYFPSYLSCSIDGIVHGLLLCKNRQQGSIAHERTAFIFAFAQREMTARFTEGIDPRYEEEIERLIEFIIHSYPSSFLGSWGRSWTKARSPRSRRSSKGWRIRRSRTT